MFYVFFLPIAIKILCFPPLKKWRNLLYGFMLKFIYEALLPFEALGLHQVWRSNMSLRWVIGYYNLSCSAAKSKVLTILVWSEFGLCHQLEESHSLWLTLLVAWSIEHLYRDDHFTYLSLSSLIFHVTNIGSTVFRKKKRKRKHWVNKSLVRQWFRWLMFWNLHYINICVSALYTLF